MNKTFVWLVVILIFALFSSFVYADTVTYKATSKVTTSIASTPAGVAISSSLDSAILDFFTNGLKGTLRRPNGSTFSTGDYRNAIISYVKEYYDIKVKPGTSAKGEATFEFTRKPNLTIKGSTPKTRSTRSSSVKTSKQIADLKLKLEQVAKATAEAKAEANVKITGNTGSAPAGKTIVINKIYINSADGRVTTVPITPGQPAPPAPAPNLVQVTRIAPTTTIINSAPIGETFSPFSNFNSNLTIANAINFSAPVVTTANITLPPGVTIPSGVILPPGYAPPAGINVIIIPQGSTIPAGITFPPGTTFHQNFTFNTFKITRVTVNQTNPPTNPTNTSKIPYKKIFKGSLLYALAVGADSVIVDYYSTDSDKINWKEVGIDAGLKAGKTFAIASVVGITIAKGASWAAARSSVAATIVKGLNPVGWGLIIGGVLGGAAINYTDSWIWKNIDVGSKGSYPVKKYTGLDEEEFFSKSDIGVSNKSYKLIINPSSGMEANGVFFLPGITGVEREVSSLTNEVVDVTGSRMWVPGEYVVSSDGVISRTISSLEQYKKLVSEESGYDHFSYGVFRFLTGNLSGANKDVQIAVTENFINAFKNELVKEVTYKVYSDNPETKALEEVASGDCSVKKDIMQINCNLNGLQLSEPGFYVYQIRVKFNELELLHFIDDYHFNELLEKNCGVEPLSDFNGDIVDAICRIDVMGVYNEYEKSYTPEAKQAMENLNSSINSQINEFENNVPPKIKGLIERVLVAKNESFSSLKSKFQPNNVDLKHTNAAILNGYPIYGFIIVGDPAKGIEDISKIEVSDEFVEVTEPALGGQSVVYYDKLLNARIFSGAIIPTPQELKEDVESKKGLVEGEKSDSPSSAKGGATITWSNLLPTTDYEISFAPVNGKSLKMTFTKSKWSGVRYVDVLVNNSPVNCYNSPYAGLANYFGGKNTLVLGWFETEEHCDYPVDGRYVVDTKLSSEGDYYKLEITSPLIPTSCSGQTISATNQNINLSC